MNTQKLFKHEFVLIASETKGTFADGSRADVEEYLDGFQDGKVFLERTSLLEEELKQLEHKEPVDVALVDEDGYHRLFPRILPFQAQWIVDKATDEEHVRVFKSSDAISMKQYNNLTTTEKMIETFGESVWFIVNNTLTEFEYKIIPSEDGLFGRLDLQDDEEETVYYTKDGLIKYAIELLDGRIEANAEYEDLVESIKEQKKPLEEALEESLEEAVEKAVAEEIAKEIAESNQEDKMMDLLGERVWEVIKFNLETCGYKLRIVSESEFGLTDLEYDKEDERIISKLELLKFFVDDIENRIHALPNESKAPHQKDLNILTEAIAIEEIEANRTRATTLEKHMINKTIGKLLDEWLDMQNYTVYKDEFGQLYYIDEIKANGNDRIDYIRPTTLRDIVGMVIQGIKDLIQNADYDDKELDELYFKDIRILEAYLNW